jgi:hypothetical protein
MRPLQQNITELQQLHGFSKGCWTKPPQGETPPPPPDLNRCLPHSNLLLAPTALTGRHESLTSLSSLTQL